MKLDLEIKSRLQQLAQARRRSPHWLMREAIEQYIEREERRERVRQDALSAWAEYSGLHVTAEEADAWLAQLEAGEDAEPPAQRDRRRCPDVFFWDWAGPPFVMPHFETEAVWPGQDLHGRVRAVRIA